MRGLENIMRRAAAQEATGRAQTRMAIVSGYDPHRYAVKARLQPEDVETGWLPVLSPWVGPDWGLFTPPSIGNVVAVHFQEGGIGAGFVSLCAWSSATPPLAVASGELWAVHGSGAFVKLTNDGKASFADKAGSSIVMNGDGTGVASFAGGLTVNANVQVNGNIIASGQISDINGAHGTLSALRDAYDGHSHSGVQSGSGTTSGPNDTV